LGLPLLKVNIFRPKKPVGDNHIAEKHRHGQNKIGSKSVPGLSADSSSLLLILISVVSFAVWRRPGNGIQSVPGTALAGVIFLLRLLAPLIDGYILIHNASLPFVGFLLSLRSPSACDTILNPINIIVMIPVV